MASLSSIRGNITTQLTAVTQLKDVQSGRVLNFTGFPACRHYLSGVRPKLVANDPFYERVWGFTIEVIQEMTQKDVTTAEANFQDAIEAVLNRLNANWTLGDNVDVSGIETGDVNVEEFPFGPCQVMRIAFEAKVHV